MPSGYKQKSILLSISYILFFCISNSAHANQVIHAQVSFVGTQPELIKPGNDYSARIRVRLKDSICGKDKKEKERWISITSGRMDGVYAHNSANFDNAFNLLMTAFLTGKRVQIDGASACSGKITLNLYSGFIGIY